MKHILLFMLVFVSLATPALATPAQDLAASKGITVELAESDLAVQERAGDITTDVRTALGSHYGGVWFDLKTGYFMVALPPGASKSAAQSVMYDLPAKYPAVKRSYDDLRAARSRIEGEQSARIRSGRAMASIYERGNTVRLYYATSAMSSETRSQVKTQAVAAGGVAVATAGELVGQPMSCVHATNAGGGGWCDDRILGGVSYHEVPREIYPEHWQQGAGCSVAFTAYYQNRPIMLSAGHCAYALKGQALPRQEWECFAYPFGECHPAAPWPPSPGECKINVWPGHWAAGETGDYGAFTLESCTAEPRVSTWFEPYETLEVKARERSMFNCLRTVPDCNRTIPTDAKPYPGEWICHYGMNAQYEGPDGGWGYHCGEVKLVDNTTVVAFSTGAVPEPHLMVVCTAVIPGDSGSGMIQRAGTHAVALGILSAGASNRTICPGEQSMVAYSYEMWAVLGALGGGVELERFNP